MDGRDEINRLRTHVEDALEQLGSVQRSIDALDKRVSVNAMRLDKIEREDTIEQEVVARLRTIRKARYTTLEKALASLVAGSAVGGFIIALLGHL